MISLGYRINKFDPDGNGSSVIQDVNKMQLLHLKNSCFLFRKSALSPLSRDWIIKKVKNYHYRLKGLLDF